MRYQLLRIEEREKESKALKKILIYCFVASSLTHIAGIIFLTHLFKQKEFVEADEPIEIIVIDKPKDKISPTPQLSVKPQAVSQVLFQDAKTRLIQPNTQLTIDFPAVGIERNTIKSLRKFTPKPPFYSPERITKIKSKNRKNTRIESLKKPTSKPSKRKELIPTDSIATNSNDSVSVTSSESSSRLNTDKDEASPANSNPDYIGNNQEHITLEKPINSKPLVESDSNKGNNYGVTSNNEDNDLPAKSNPDSIGNNQGNTTLEKPINSKTLAESASNNGNNYGGTSNNEDNDLAANSNPDSIGNNQGNPTLEKLSPPAVKPKLKPANGGGKCIKNCGLPKANSYIRRNFDHKERTVRITVTFNENGKVTNIQINPSTGNGSYDRVIRREASRLRFSQGKSGILTFRFNIVKSGSKKAREAKKRKRERERRQEAEEKRRLEQEAKKR